MISTTSPPKYQVRLKDSGNTIKYLMPVLFKIIPSYLVMYIVLQALLTVIPLWQIWLTKIFMNAMVEVLSTHIINTSLYVIFILQFVSVLLLKCVHYCLQYFQLKMGSKVDHYFHKMISDKSIKLTMIFFENSQSYDQLQRISLGIGTRGLQIFTAFISTIQNILQMVGYIVVLYMFSPLIAAVLIVLIIPHVLSNTKVGDMKFIQMLRHTPSSRKMNYFGSLFFEKRSIREIKLFNLYPFLFEKWNQYYWMHVKERLALERKSTRILMSVDILSTATTFALTLLVLYQGVRKHITIGDYSALAQAIISAQVCVTNIQSNVSKIYQEALFSSEITSYLALPEENSEHEGDRLFPTPLVNGIEVNGISFSYPHNNQPTLSDISLSIRPGEKIAIVGDNGAGKSTLIKCLLGLYSPQTGKILIDGISLKDISTDSLRTNISVVFQDFLQYQLSLRENIGFGNINDIDDDAAIYEAASRTGLEEVIERFPQGLETELSVQFEGGRELSLGQWQRVAISRAFFKKADIMILDEPTASLDPLSEVKILQHFLELSEGRTSLFITHRLGICKAVDRIIVMREGRVVEEGSHDNLIEADGEYKKMFMAQASLYAEKVHSY